MIYAGVLNFSSLSVAEDCLTKAVGSFTSYPPTVISKDTLILCYGKLSKIQDMDDVWQNNASILMGRAFEKENSCALKKETFKEFSHLNKEDVLKKIWGKYIYINIHKEPSQFDIVIDSTGQLPFFYYTFPNGNILFASDIEIIFKVLSQKTDYNWPYLYSYLIYGNSSSVETPFKNIFELPPACSLKITKNERKTSPFWNPLDSYKTPDAPKKEAVSILQSTLKPWIEPYETVCVSLSGGLDSSSLVYCLKDIVKKDQTLKALNYFHSQIKSSNELIHARKVCEETGIDLIEVDASESLPFKPSHKTRPLNPNKPFPGLISLCWLETIFNNISSTGSFTFISGHGSDHIFMRPPSQKSISDYIIEKGLKGSKDQFKGMAHFYRDPLFSLFKLNFKTLFSHFLGMKKEKSYVKDQLNDVPTWIKKELLKNASCVYSHPMDASLTRKILPGKKDQIDALYQGFSSIQIEMMDQAAPTFYPFFYEPVIEFALSFPTYELFDKGYDRYPLRKSVSDSFKTETVWRRDKSQTTGLFQLGVKNNLEHVLELCLEGHFVKTRLIDREALQKTIMLIGNGDPTHMWPFIHLASVEMFLKYWDERKSG
ncbi:MAG: hypothetical protein B7Y25_06555 [Alphaproteobacteria bacterium 16-39-46]|nr:MAG: hypothetical protein B7Y25_06555 [Alphaproteobacteria bacterium 16-39-46]OZA42264.1 MAG: hypothetical protein B7X84_06640 [Alphaproteobacteria bacterium 17-39-52]HQS84543.1 asparagine synthase-related protein [Alphaproteobacteria bacterium]HQS94346.1 asparagine synthase-related protein [Alphaproteobacteria bacterium]